MNPTQLIQQLRPATPARLAVAAADDDNVLKAVAQAAEQGIATAILCGDRARIAAAATACSLDVSAFEIVQAGPGEEARAAVSLVRSGKADMLMKGLLQTSDLLRAVLDKETGLRTGRILSHVSLIQSPVLERLVLITDAAMVTYPDLPMKVKMTENAVGAAIRLGIACPKVAALAAVELVNPDMPATLDAALLTMMNRRGQIKDCVIDGPLAMDLAISADAAAHKGIDSPVAGAADILLAHNIDVANSVVKTFTHGGNALFGGVVLGAAAPIVLASRADSELSKLYSIACAAAICG